MRRLLGRAMLRLICWRQGHWWVDAPSGLLSEARCGLCRTPLYPRLVGSDL